MLSQFRNRACRIFGDKASNKYWFTIFIHAITISTKLSFFLSCQRINYCHLFQPIVWDKSDIFIFNRHGFELVIFLRQNLLVPCLELDSKSGAWRGNWENDTAPSCGLWYFISYYIFQINRWNDSMILCKARVLKMVQNCTPLFIYLIWYRWWYLELSTIDKTQI